MGCFLKIRNKNLLQKITNKFLSSGYENRLICSQSSCDSKGNDDEDSFISSVTQRKRTEPKNKITVIGVGQVGMACAVSCLYYGLTTDLCLFDQDKKKMLGEAMDLQHGTLFLGGARVTAASDISETANSRLVIISAGSRQKEGEKRPQLINRNIMIIKSFIKDLVNYSPDCTIIVVSNPCDALTYVTWKLSGLPVSKVMGSGTNLDTSRFRYLISEKLNINVKNCHGFIIGEHGDTSVPVWSGVNVGGVLFRARGSKNEDNEQWDGLHKRTVSAAYDIIQLKGYTSWAVGFSVGKISESIMKNTLSIHCVTTNLKGLYSIEEDIFASVPCIVGEGGILGRINLPLNEKEEAMMHKSIHVLKTYQNSSNI